MLKVLILGGGVSALYSWYAAISAGYTEEEVQIWGNEVPIPKGAFWLHALPPQVQAVGEPLQVKYSGKASVYSWKQWKKEYPTSWGKFGAQLVYNPHQYIPLLRKNCNLVPTSVTFSQKEINRLSTEVQFLVQTFSTDPALLEIMQSYKFPIVSYPVESTMPEVIYSGEDDVPWVRKTTAWGYSSWEYPVSWKDANPKLFYHAYTVPPEITFAPDLPPWLEPNSSCRVGKNIILTGRWALGDRRFLSHESYSHVLQELQKGIV